MKKLFLTMLTLAMTLTINGQSLDPANIKVEEPGFEQEAIIVTGETTGIPIEVEHAKLKTTGNVGLAILGIVQTSSYYQLEGPKSNVTLDASAYNNDLYIILSWSDNKRSPKRLFQIIPLEIQNKRRIYNVAKFNSFSGDVQADQGYVNFTASKYGDHSYLIKISKAELQRFRDNNKGEAKKYGKQYVFRLLNASADKLSDTEDFLTFGIEKDENLK